MDDDDDSSDDDDVEWDLLHHHKNDGSSSQPEISGSTVLPILQVPEREGRSVSPMASKQQQSLAPPSTSPRRDHSDAPTPEATTPSVTKVIDLDLPARTITPVGGEEVALSEIPPLAPASSLINVHPGWKQPLPLSPQKEQVEPPKA